MRLAGAGGHVRSRCKIGDTGTVDDDELGEARQVLERVLAAVERGDLDAAPVQVGALVGALETVKALQQTVV